MVDKEMLSAISELLDEKLDGLKTDVAELKTDVAQLKTDVAELKADVAELKTDVAEMQKDVTVLKERVTVLEKDVSGLKEDMRNVKVKVDQLEESVLPRLSTIEQCYLDTYRRYVERTEQFDQMSEDIKTIKGVLSNHSTRLNKIPV